MQIIRPRTALAAAAVVLGLGLGQAPLARAADIPAPAPKLVVVISIDQFSANLFEQWRGQFTGGLGRLAREGVVYPSGYQSHAMTETCPGHSTLLTGKHPNKTGIVSNDTHDRATGVKVYCLAEADVTLAHDPKAPGVGPERLMADTYGDWLKAVSPASKVYGVSGKDRGAITLAGHKADGTFWFEPSFGFTTYVRAGETAAAKLAPVAALNAQLAAEQKKKPFVWTYADKRCQALEATYVTGGRTWKAQLPPPAATDAAGDLRDLYASPYTDAATLRAATSLREQFHLGDGPAVDVLTVSLSATDFIGHRYGSRGPEMCDQIARLDAGLGRFLTEVAKAKGGVLVVLAADHGGSDFPERLKAQGYDAGRVPGAAWVKDINTQLRASLGLAFDPLVQAGGINQLYVVGADKKALPPVERTRITTAALALVRAQPVVSSAYDVDALLTEPPAAADIPPDEISVEERMRRSAYPERSGDILIAFKPYLTMAAASATYVAGHGTPWNYDRRVPIIFWWPGAAGRERILPLDTVDIAPTLAAVTGVKPPADVDGRCQPLGSDGRC
ncbi:MAG: alkaline phosphatase family protein [Caulobacter sp.]|nr:alkaline phosphatase family protein [Caulobacter sp.]